MVRSNCVGSSLERYVQVLSGFIHRSCLSISCSDPRSSHLPVLSRGG